MEPTNQASQAPTVANDEQPERVWSKAALGGRGWVNPAKAAAVAVALGVAILLPYQYNSDVNLVFAQVLYIAIAAMGLNLLTGFTGQISIGHGAFFGIGAFTSGILVVNHGMTYELTIPLAALVAAAVGIFVGFPALRVKGLYLALITLGLAVLFPIVAKRFVKGSGGVALLQPKKGQVSSFFPDVLADDLYIYFLCLFLLALLLGVMFLLQHSRMGRAMIAVRDQEVAAKTVGINVAKVKVVAFAISAAYAGVAGSLSFAVTKIADATNPLVYFQLSIEFLIAVVIGGTATISGPVIGAMALVWIRRQTDSDDDWLIQRLSLEGQAAQLAPALLGGILIVLTYVLPDGLVGGVRRLGNRVTRARSQPGGPARPNAAVPPASTNESTA